MAEVIAGLMPWQHPEQRPSNYIWVESVADYVARAKEFGASVVMNETPVGEPASNLRKGSVYRGLTNTQMRPWPASRLSRAMPRTGAFSATCTPCTSTVLTARVGPASSAAVRRVPCWMGAESALALPAPARR